MNEDRYLKALTKCIESPRMRKEIMREYQDHIKDCKAVLMESGMGEEEAEEEAVKQMGDPKEAGRGMNRLYKEVLDLGMALWFSGVSITLLLLRWIIVNDGGEFDVYLSVLNYIGKAFVIYGLLLSVWEKYNDLGIGYANAKNWSAGVGAMNNSGFILGIGVSFAAQDMPEGVCITFVLAAVQVILRSFIQLLNRKRETELLWEIGIADTVVTYKGKGTFLGRQIKIKTREEEIQPGTPIIIVAMEGPKPIVVRI
ncbi:MAG: hypothetical protein HFH03_02445 [Dorea sp.]|jgi:hypothetical protein|nr:hypothetical protein [Dorea sp.]